VAKELTFGKDARNRMLIGINAVARLVSATIGPKGRCIVVERVVTNPATKEVVKLSPVTTKDGVYVARAISLPNATENLGCDLIREAALRTVQEAGDGTTASVILSQAIISEGMKALEKGASPVFLRSGIDKATAKIVQQLAQMSTRYDGMGLDVARIAANGDEEVAKIVTEALQMAGKNGIVSVDSSRTDKTHIEFSAGMRFDSGFRHPDFITDFSRNECVLENPFILLHERRIQRIGKIEPLLAAVAQAGRSILILSEEFELPVMALLLQNRAVLRSCVVTAPWYGERRRDFLSDLAAFTGGISIVEELGLDLSKCDLSVLGQAERVVVTRTNTTIIKGKSKGNELAQRIESLSSAIASTENPYDKEILAERLAKLDGGVAVIKIGAPTESEAKEKRDRTEDAVLSVKCAQEDGTVPGGGIALLRCQESVNFSGEKLHNEELVGIGIVFHALEAPLKQILENGGYNVKDTMKCLKGRADSIGFDALSGEVVDMRDKGIMDASKVVKQALINAASLAGTFLTVAGSIVNLEAKGA